MPLTDLLDHAASPSQEHLMLDTISDAQAFAISPLDNKITHLQVVMDRLMQEHESPIMRLPPEVLSEIFIQCTIDPFYLHTGSPRFNKVPLLIGNVCSRWRNISLSTPRLWASFSLTIRPKNQKNDVVLANTWLARAGTCPLYISLGSSIGSHHKNSMRPLMEVFTRHCEHWYEVYLSLPQHVLRSLSAVKNRLPMLQKLHLGGLLDDSIDIFESAPRLYCFHDDWPKQLAVKVPWNQLREFKTGYCSFDDYLAILRLTPNLEVLEARVDIADSDHTHSPIQLPHLHSLSIYGNIACALDRLILPKLRSISVDTRGAEWPTIPQLTSILSQCSIESLSCSTHTPFVADSDMIRLLQMCPSLLKLDLLGSNSYCMTKSFLSRLAYRRDSDIATTKLVPKLHTIVVDHVSSHFDLQDFVDAVQSRMMLGGEGRPEPEVTRLKTVEIRHIRGTLEPKILSRLRQLKAMGLDIRLLIGGEDEL